MLESIQRQIKTKKQYTKTYGCNENGSKKEGKFILINVYDKKEEGSQINNLILHTPQGTRKKKKQAKPSHQKEGNTDQSRNKIENRKMIGKVKQ